MHLNESVIAEVTLPVLTPSKTPDVAQLRL